MVFSAVVNDINSLISLLIHYWCIEMQSTSAYWLYILILSWIPVSILEVFWWSHLDFPRRVSRLWAGKDWFLLANLDTLYSFWCLIAEAKTSNSMVNKSAESGYPRRVQFFTIEDDMSCGTFISGYSHVEAWYFYPSFHEVFFFFFTTKGCCCILSNVYSASMERIMWLLSFLLSMWCITSVDLQILNWWCIPGINPTSLWGLILFMYCWIRCANLVANFCIQVHQGNWSVVFLFSGFFVQFGLKAMLAS